MQRYLQGNRLELIEKGVLDGMAALTLLYVLPQPDIPRQTTTN